MIQLPAEGRTCLTVPRTGTVGDLLLRLAGRTHLPPDMLRLTYAGVSLTPDQRLQDLSLSPDHELQLHLRVRGGSGSDPIPHKCPHPNK